jgi:hypothetical protein
VLAVPVPGAGTYSIKGIRKGLAPARRDRLVGSVFQLASVRGGFADLLGRALEPADDAITFALAYKADVKVRSAMR